MVCINFPYIGVPNYFGIRRRRRNTRPSRRAIVVGRGIGWGRFFNGVVSKDDWMEPETISNLPLRIHSHSSSWNTPHRFRWCCTKCNHKIDVDNFGRVDNLRLHRAHLVCCCCVRRSHSAEVLSPAAYSQLLSSVISGLRKKK
jgi:hypothetical protein